MQDNLFPGKFLSVIEYDESVYSWRFYVISFFGS